MVPIVHQRKNESKTDYIKRYTNILYDCLPQTSLEDREKYHDIRDKIIELNYGFFGYVVKNKFLNCPYAEYEDKVQGCIQRFCECWTWYRFKKKYNKDVTFAVFYKPRLGEMLERSFNEVGYSLRRSLLVEVSEQIHKPWTEITYEDLSDPRIDIPPNHKMSLMAIFGALNPASSDEISPYLEAPDDITKEKSPVESLTDQYNDVVSLLVHEMVDREKKLTTRDLSKIAEIYDLDLQDLKQKLPLAEKQLYELLKSDSNS